MTQLTIGESTLHQAHMEVQAPPKRTVERIFNGTAEPTSKDARCTLCGCLTEVAHGFRVVYADLPLPPRRALICVYCAATIEVEAVKELSSLRDKLAQVEADFAASKVLPETAAHLDEVWASKKQAVKIDGTFHGKRVKIISVQHASGKLPVRYAFDVIAPDGTPVSSGTTSEPSLTSDYAREVVP